VPCDSYRAARGIGTADDGIAAAAPVTADDSAADISIDSDGDGSHSRSR
jgi:hypothetical protein